MVQLPDITTLISEVQTLSARVDTWLDQADATVGGYAQLQADLQALQAQVQQLAGSDGTVAAHTHQISEVQGLAAALAAKLDDAAGIIQTHHIADGAITATKIADGAITAQHLTGLAGGAGYQTLPGGIIMQWGVLSAVSLNQVFHAIVWPVAFPAVVEAVLATIEMGGIVGGAIVPVVRNISAAGCEIAGDYVYATATGSIHWMAIGR